MDNSQALIQGNLALNRNSEDSMRPNLRFHPAPADYVPRETLETPNLRLVYGEGADKIGKGIDYVRHNIGLYSLKLPEDYGSNAYSDTVAGQTASRNSYGLHKESRAGYEMPEEKSSGVNLASRLGDLVSGLSLPSVDGLAGAD